MLKADGVAVGAKEGDAAGFARHAEGLEAFQHLLPIVKGWRHAVDAHVRVGDELEGRPFASGLGVGGFDMAVDCKEC